MDPRFVRNQSFRKELKVETLHNQVKLSMETILLHSNPTLTDPLSYDINAQSGIKQPKLALGDQ